MLGLVRDHASSSLVRSYARKATATSNTVDKLKKELKKRKVADSVVSGYAKKAALKRCLYEVMGHATVDLTAGHPPSST